VQCFVRSFELRSAGHLTDNRRILPHKYFLPEGRTLPPCKVYPCMLSSPKLPLFDRFDKTCTPGGYIRLHPAPGLTLLPSDICTISFLAEPTVLVPLHPSMGRSKARTFHHLTEQELGVFQSPVPFPSRTTTSPVFSDLATGLVHSPHNPPLDLPNALPCCFIEPLSSLFDAGSEANYVLFRRTKLCLPVLSTESPVFVGGRRPDRELR